MTSRDLTNSKNQKEQKNHNERVEVLSNLIPFKNKNTEEDFCAIISGVNGILMKGNEAVAEAAIQAGCRFYAGYPITPQNEIPEYMARRMSEVGGIFIQAESELAAINMVYGASGTGKRVLSINSDSML